MTDRSFLDTLMAFPETHPEVVVSLTGPWPSTDDEGEVIWLCNFKTLRSGNRYLHPGSRGLSPDEALSNGLQFLNAWTARRDAGDPVWEESVVREIMGEIEAGSTNAHAI